MSLLSKYTYYARSALTILAGFKNPWQVGGVFLRRPMGPPTVIQLRKQGWQFFVRDAMDIWVIKETCLDGDYLWGAPFESDWSVLDVGAGLGDFTVLAGERCPRGVVHAYEPLEESFRLLQQNLALNGIANAHIYQVALANDVLTLQREEVGVNAVSTRFVSDKPGTGVHAISLAAALDKLPRNECDFLKLDCEGCEYDLLLESPPATLRRIRRVMIETHDGYSRYSAADLAAFLRQSGFSVRQRANPVHAFLGLLYAERA